MSKFLYFQDSHCKGKNSINRIGDYFSDWLIKFDELLSIAKENKVEAILDGGDLLDNLKIDNYLLDEIIDRVEKNKITIYFLFGNHAEYFRNIELTWKHSSLAHASKRSKYFKYLCFDDLGYKDINIKGFEYSHNIEEELKSDGIIIEGNQNIWKIAIVHAFICPEKFPYATHVICDDIKTNADLILVAHYHKVWQKKIGNTEYIDIGCFGRNSITEADIKPACILLDTEKRSYEIIYLKSAKNGKEVFDFKNYEEKKNKELNLEDFIQSLESTQFQSQKIENYITEIATEQNIDKEITDLIFSKIKEVQNEN